MSFRLLSAGWIISSWMHAGEMALDHHVFWMPEGLVVEKVAGPPLVNRPIVADLDARGDLYVADSSGSNDKVAQQLEKRPHRIVRLRDQDGDGLYDSSVVFADGLMFPEGILCYQGAVYCAPSSNPSSRGYQWGWSGRSSGSVDGWQDFDGVCQ